MIFDVLFLPLLLFIGLAASYEDIRYGRVRNKWILLGLGWGLSVIVGLFIWYFISSGVMHFYYFHILNLPLGSPAPVYTVSLGYLFKVILNAALALMAAFLMWQFNAWAAGDAKLFFVFALLVPLKYYWKSYFPLFPSFVLLINIFLPLFAYLLLRSFFYWFKLIYLKLIKTLNLVKPSEKETNKLAGKEGNKPETKKLKLAQLKNTVVMLLFFTTIFLIFALFRAPIKNYTSINPFSFQMFLFAGFIIFSGLLSKIFQKPITLKITIISLIGMLGYGFFYSPGPTITARLFLQTVGMMIIFMVILGLFRKMVDFYVLKTSLKEIKIEELKPKMSLAEDAIQELRKDKKYYHVYIGHIYPDGLTVRQVEAIRKWAQEKGDDQIKTVKVYKSFPFVVWMFIGVIITLFLQGSLLNLFLGFRVGTKLWISSLLKLF